MQLDTGFGEMFAAGGARSDVNQREADEEIEPHGGNGALKGGVWGNSFPVVELIQDLRASVQAKAFWIGYGSSDLYVEM